MENKEAIIKSLVRTLQMTRLGENVVDGEYFKDGGDETAILYVRDTMNRSMHPVTVNITADSGISIIKDIIYAMEY